MRTEDTQETQVSQSDFSCLSNTHPDLYASFTVSRSWPAGSFCDEFIGKTFVQDGEMCGNGEDSPIWCSWAKYSRKIGTCTVNQLALAPDKLLTAIQNSQLVLDSSSLWLLRDPHALSQKPCPRPDIRTLDKRFEPDDYIKSLLATAMLTAPGKKCQRWVNGTAFLYLGVNTHIYFKFMSWYNLHKTILWHRNVKDYTIVRLPPNDHGVQFDEFEKILFPEISSLDELGVEVTCFKYAVIVPWAYAATPFRCNMEDSSLKMNCLACDGTKVTNSDLMTFRRRVLEACSVTNRDPQQRANSTKNILVIQRKQYLRHENDKPDKFQRIWVNSQEFIDALHKHYPKAKITGIHAEDLPICEQVRYAHSADLLIGIHGAGLVHLWWMQKDSLFFELAPPSKHGNAAFRVLSKLLGRRMHSSVRVIENGNRVTVAVKGIIRTLRSVFPP